MATRSRILTRNSMDRGAWRATVPGAAGSRTSLRDQASLLPHLGSGGVTARDRQAHCALPPSSGSFPGCSALQRHPFQILCWIWYPEILCGPKTFISLTYHPVLILVNSKSFHRSNLRTILSPCCLVAQLCPTL